jgi:hypothetical protein
MDRPKKINYRPLEDTEQSQLKRLSSAWTARRVSLALFVGAVAIIALFTVYRLWISPNIDQCGTTPAEARARGCVFEMIGFSWLPKDCHDAEVEAEFRIMSQDLEYYRDMNYTERVSIEEASQGNGPGFYVNQDYHKAHCAFLLKKLHRAVSSGRRIDGLISPVAHTSHCVHMLLGSPNYRADALQMATVKFPYCGRPGGFNVVGSRPGKWTDSFPEEQDM